MLEAPHETLEAVQEEINRLTLGMNEPEYSLKKNVDRRNRLFSKKRELLARIGNSEFIEKKGQDW